MTSRMRWFLYAIALALTLIAVRWAGSDDRSGASVVGPVAASPGRESVRPPLVATVQLAQSAALDLERLNRADHKRPSGDPFRAHNWAEAEPAAQRRAQPVQPPPPPPAPEAPPLPYTFFGRMVENGKTVVFLNIQDRIAVGRVGDTLDSRYRIESIDEQVITFNYLPLDIRQQLVLPGGANSNGAVSASQAGLPGRSAASPRARRGREEDDD